MKATFDRETVESLMAEVRATPEKFADAKAVVERSGFGPTRLSELLREHYGTTPAELLLRAKLEKAKNQLLSGATDSVIAVAAEAGFESLSVFHENFRRYTGMTPGAYRRNTGAARTAAPAMAETFTIPFGLFSLAVSDDGSVLAAAFGPESALKAILPRVPFAADSGRTAAARREITSYFQGSLARFTVRLRPNGTPFQKRVWAALDDIPCGETRSYVEIAGEVGSSPRAVGRAVATNPICLIVPCHRVIGADGSLTGYAYGVELKRRLLEHEAAMVKR